MDQFGVEMIEATFKLLDQGLAAFEKSQPIRQGLMENADEFPDWIVAALQDDKEMSYHTSLLVGQDDPLDAWANMDLKELREFDAGITSVVFYLPLVLLIQPVGLLFYPLLVVFGIKSFSEWFSFIGSTITNTWKVPVIIIERLYAVGYNFFYILYLINFTILQWIWAFFKVYLGWLLPIFGYTLIGLFYTAYFVRWATGWLFFYAYTGLFTIPQLLVEWLWIAVKWIWNATIAFIKWSWELFVASLKWAWNATIAFWKWAWSANIAFWKFAWRATIAFWQWAWDASIAFVKWSWELFVASLKWVWESTIEFYKW